MTAKLYIVRHGNTFEKGDIVTRVGGRTDMPLSPSGRDQAAALAGHFAAQGIAFATARSGPLRRTRETASAILSKQAGAPEPLNELFLREIDYGPDENRPEDEVIARIGKPALEAWERDMIPPRDWRVDPQALIANWQQLFDALRNAPGDHLIVTSNGIARFALAAANAAGHPPKLATAAWGVIDLTEQGETIEAWNARITLPP